METKRIVVINDDPTQLKLLGRVIERFGYEVRTYLDAAEALAGLAGRPLVDLFVVDLHMPGIDGWKLCRLLRSPDFAPFNETPILIVSATFTGADVEAITADLGANAFLPLPFTREDLLEYIADLLEGKHPRRRSRVLLVEDDEAVARTVLRAFESNGFTVEWVTTGAEAMQFWSEQRADVVLLDYHLPDGTCEDLVAAVASPADRTVVIVMTGDTDPNLPVALLSRGADAYVRKPFDPAFVVELARKAQRERSLLRVEAILEQRTQELRSSERRYRSLFDAIPEMVMVLDDNDRIIQVNDKASRALKQAPEAFRDRHFLELVPPDSALQTNLVLDRIRGGEPESFEATILGSDRSLTVEITAIATEDHGRQVVLLVARDLTWRREAEEEQHAQRLESLGVLAGGIAHDFNNLLVGILGNASLALLESEDGGSVGESLNQIEMAAKRAAELTQQILTFAGRGKAVLKEVDLSELVSEMGQLLEPAVSKKARLTYKLPDTTDRVKGDASQIRQVVMNLIMNASDALGEKTGTITVEAHEQTLDRRALGAYYLGESAEPGRYTCLSVADDGCGMDEATRKQIFDPFFTTKFTGRGLGLAATLGIMRAHHGMISVSSHPGHGTRFEILLPCLKGAPDAKLEAASLEEHTWTRGGTILVVDDERAVRQLSKASLERNGFTVLLAGDGVRGLEVLAENPHVDAVLLDLTMPELDGLQVLKRIRETQPDLPVLLSSGYTDEAIPPETLGRRTAFLRKPYLPSELLSMLSKLLYAPRLRHTRTSEAS